MKSCNSRLWIVLFCRWLAWWYQLHLCAWISESIVCCLSYSLLCTTPTRVSYSTEACCYIRNRCEISRSGAAETVCRQPHRRCPNPHCGGSSRFEDPAWCGCLWSSVQCWKDQGQVRVYYFVFTLKHKAMTSLYLLHHAYKLFCDVTNSLEIFDIILKPCLASTVSPCKTVFVPCKIVVRTVYCRSRSDHFQHIVFPEFDIIF